MKAQQALIPGLADTSVNPRHAAVRAALKQMNLVMKQDSDAVFSRQVEEDPFDRLYDSERLLQPPYSFERLYLMYEESDVLQSCVEAMQHNVDGFGYELMFLGDDVAERENANVVAEKTMLENFFDYANETQSLRTVRTLMREDFEVIGNGAFEIVRNRGGAIQLMYHMPFKNIRISALETRMVTVPVTLKRGGKDVTLKIKKKFRRYAQIQTSTGRKVRWFKAFGDPRFLDAVTGEFKSSASACKIVASEMMHFKYAFGGLAYGLPRWIGAVLEVMGRRNAQFVNFDLFDSQGIPPMAVLVSGGVLTDESVEELEAMIRSMRGVEKWNRVMLLESNIETVGLEEKGTARIELKNLAEYRKEDQMFATYLGNSEKCIRHRYRMPPLYVGAAESFTHATAKSAQNVAEEQVFIPERATFDEVMNSEVVQKEMKVTNWKYHTKGPQVVGAEEISDGIQVFSQAGALTVNNAIQLANRAFGIEMSQYDAPWANYPIQLVTKLLEAGNQIKGVQEFAEALPEPVATVPQQRTIPSLPKKIFKSDMFSDEEKRLYKRLIFLQDAIDRGVEENVITEKELEAEAL